MRWWFTILFLLLATVQSSAQTRQRLDDPDFYLAECRAPTPTRAQGCLEFAVALQDMLTTTVTAFGADIAVCPFPAVKLGDLQNILVGYLSESAEHRKYSTAGAFIDAMRRAFPCKSPAQNPTVSENTPSVAVAAGYFARCKDAGIHAPIYSTCLSMVWGMKMALQAVDDRQKPGLYCSGAADLSQMMDAFWLYMNANQGTLQKPTATVFLDAMQQKYPCR